MFEGFVGLGPPSPCPSRRGIDSKHEHDVFFKVSYQKNKNKNIKITKQVTINCHVITLT